MLLEALRGNPALDHDNNIHEYDTCSILRYLKKKLSKITIKFTCVLDR